MLWTYEVKLNLVRAFFFTKFQMFLAHKRAQGYKDRSIDYTDSGLFIMLKISGGKNIFGGVNVLFFWGGLNLMFRGLRLPCTVQNFRP